MWALSIFKLRKVRNSLGAAFPREALVRLHVGEGNRQFFTEAADGVRIAPYDPAFARQMALVEEGMARSRGTLGALAG